MKFNVTVDTRGMEAKLKASAEELKKALPRALNRVATTARAQGARLIVDQGYGIAITEVKRNIKISKASGNNFLAVVTASGRPIPLIRFKARETKAGVTVQVKNGRKLIKGAFIAVMPSGHRGVFVRKDGARHVSKRVRRGGPAAPIKELFGPGIPKEFQQTIVIDALKQLVRDKFPSVLRSEMKYVLSKR